MMSVPMTSEVLAPLLAVLCGAAFTAMARQIAPKLGLVDCPDGGRKLHRTPTPVMGGAAFFAAMCLVTAVSFLLECSWTQDGATRTIALNLFASGSLFCALGVIDDRLALRPRVKFIGQILASLPFACMTSPLERVSILDIEIPLGFFAVPFMVFWLVCCSNVINLIDGLDGLAGTIGTISLLTIAALFLGKGTPGPAILTLIASGAIVGFLIHNWPPAKIFMGDGGSMTIGFLVGALSIQASSKTATGFTLAVPLVLISLPIFDTFMAIARRKLNGRGIGEGDRGHIHHRLQDYGLSRKAALLVIGGISMVMAAAAFATAHLPNELAGVLLCVAVLGALITGRVFGYHETMLFFRHLNELGLLLIDTSGAVRTRFLIARMQDINERQQAEIWRQVTHRIAQMGGIRLDFYFRNPGQSQPVSEFEWSAESPAMFQNSNVWEFSFSSIRDQGQRVSLVASGMAPDDASPQRLDDLFRLFARVCREMPLTGLPDQTSRYEQDDAASIPLPEKTPLKPLRTAA